MRDDRLAAHPIDEYAPDAPLCVRKMAPPSSCALGSSPPTAQAEKAAQCRGAPRNSVVPTHALLGTPVPRSDVCGPGVCVCVCVCVCVAVL